MIETLTIAGDYGQLRAFQATPAQEFGRAAGTGDAAAPAPDDPGGPPPTFKVSALEQMRRALVEPRRLTLDAAEMIRARGAADPVDGPSADAPVGPPAPLSGRTLDRTA